MRWTINLLLVLTFTIANALTPPTRLEKRGPVPMASPPPASGSEVNRKQEAKPVGLSALAEHPDLLCDDSSGDRYVPDPSLHPFLLCCLYDHMMVDQFCMDCTLSLSRPPHRLVRRSSFTQFVFWASS